MRLELALTSLGCAATAILLLLTPTERLVLGHRASTPREAAASEKRAPRLALSPSAAAAAARAGLLPRGTRSVLNPGKKLAYGDFVWNDENVPRGRLLVRVDLRRQLISAFRGAQEIGTAVILYGRSDKGTPVGQFHILAKVKDHRSSVYDAPMPYTLRLTADGVAIHASDVRWGYATHGCIGVPIGFARHLFDEAKVGDLVEVQEFLPLT